MQGCVGLQCVPASLGEGGVTLDILNVILKGNPQCHPKTASSNLDSGSPFQQQSFLKKFPHLKMFNIKTVGIWSAQHWSSRYSAEFCSKTIGSHPGGSISSWRISPPLNGSISVTIFIISRLVLTGLANDVPSLLVSGRFYADGPPYPRLCQLTQNWAAQQRGE